MHKFYFALALLAFQAQANASNWQLISVTRENYVQIDFDSIAKSGKYKKLWTQTGWLNTQESRSDRKKYRSTKSQWYVDCAEKTQVGVTIVQYEDMMGGAVVNSVSVGFNPKELEDFVPGSIGEAIVQYACATPNVRSKMSQDFQSQYGGYMDALIMQDHDRPPKGP